MPHVVTENCSQCRFTDCAETCPVQCFHGDDERLYIDPDTCIDCNACIPVCPVQAIKEGVDLSENDQKWLVINAERSRDLPVITARQPPLPTALERKAALGF